MSVKPYRDLLHLTEKQVLDVVETLQIRGTRRPDERRKHERLPFHEETVLLCALRTQLGQAPFLVKCIDISAGGIGFLHGAFIHLNTPCRMTLIAGGKIGFRLTGTIARCQHFKGHIHLVGVKFDEPLDPAQLEMLKTSNCAAPAE